MPGLFKLISDVQQSAYVTPAKSRALNEPCMLMNFYDAHDLWHFLSACSMFFSFMMLVNLDDDLANRPRNEIAVF